MTEPDRARALRRQLRYAPLLGAQRQRDGNGHDHGEDAEGGEHDDERFTRRDPRLERQGDLDHEEGNGGDECSDARALHSADGTPAHLPSTVHSGAENGGPRNGTGRPSTRARLVYARQACDAKERPWAAWP